jgi:uncharacterized protein
MLQRLPELIEPDRMAETGRLLKGTIAISKMKRLRSLLFDDEGRVDLDLVFGVDESGQSNVAGALDAQITLQCQRCLQAMNLHIREKISLAIVHTSQQANKLPSHYEPLMVKQDSVSLSELVEDELILALPTVPLHDGLEDCKVDLSSTTEKRNNGSELKGDIGSNKSSVERENLKQEDSKRKNPFEVLKQLQSKKTPNED